MLLAFDVGNTNIVAGVYEGDRLVQFWRMETSQTKSADEYGITLIELFQNEGISTKDVENIIIATVVPSMIYTLQHLSRKYFGTTALVVGPGIKTGLIVKYDNPKQLGADRIVNSVAALAKYKAPLIIIDYGTATTFCAVTDKAEYLGGAIAPGIKVESDALFERTAQLPKVEIEAPGKTICRNTIEGIQAGIVYGNMGMTEYIVRQMKKEIADYTGKEQPVTVIATGGLSQMMADGVDCIDYVDKGLTLTGLQILFEKNKQLAANAKNKGARKLQDEGVY
ncbi:MAG: type III pantothenate kinase [Firmicutes bacterium]|nr:type III pantothenate kinase [Bacillota bacterium]